MSKTRYKQRADSSSIEQPKPTAYVRYASVTDDFSQGPLRPLHQPLPDDVRFSSPGIYFLSPETERRLTNDRISTKEAQKRCEENNQVLYKMVAESDALEQVDHPTTMIDCLSTFAEDWLDIDKYDFFYSGNRSIHLHTEYYITANALPQMKDVVERFNQESAVDLDPAIYQRKGQFRLVGAQHEETGLYKVPISKPIDRPKLVRVAGEHRTRKPLHRMPTVKHYTAGSGDIAAYSQKFERVIDSEYLNDLLDTDGVDEDYRSSNGRFASPISPYANTGNGKRSVILLEQLGPTQKIENEIYLPAYVREAIGGDGEYTRYNSRTRVKLSERDYRKWEYEPGDLVVIIGGRSRNSRLLGIDEWLANLVELELNEYGRAKAIQTLAMFGCEVGESGPAGNRERSVSIETRAEKLKRDIEDGQAEQSYENILTVSCRLLRLHGWQRTWEWLEEILGEDFDPEESYQRLKQIIDAYDDYDHVEIPAELYRKYS